MYDGSALGMADKDLLSRLVAFDSTSANSNLPIADFVCDYLERPGVTITRNPNGDGTKTNVVAVAGPGPTDGRGGAAGGGGHTRPASPLG